MTVTIRYFAAARHAAGTEEEQRELGAPMALSEVLHQLGDTRRPELTAVLPRCSYLINEVAVVEPAQPVADGDVVDVLPPFAGG